MKRAKELPDRVGVKMLMHGRWFWYRSADGQPAEVGPQHAEWMVRCLGGPDHARVEPIVRTQGWQGDPAEEQLWLDHEELVQVQE